MNRALLCLVVGLVISGFAVLAVDEGYLRAPSVCTSEFDPVCGSDGKTYSNACEAMKVGVGFLKGECSVKLEKDGMQESTQKIDDAKKRIKDAKALKSKVCRGRATPECKAAVEASNTAQKELMLALTGKVLLILENAKQSAVDSTIEGQERSSILGEADEMIAGANSIKQSIQELSLNASNVEVKGINDDVRDLIKETNSFASRAVLLGTTRKIKNAVALFNEKLAKVQEFIDKNAEFSKFQKDADSIKLKIVELEKKEDEIGTFVVSGDAGKARYSVRSASALIKSVKEKINILIRNINRKVETLKKI